MGDERGGGHLLVEDRSRVVFVPFEFVAHDGHLGLAVLLAQEQVAHPVGLELHGEFEMIAWEVFVVVGAVERGGRVVDAADAVHERVEAVAGPAVEIFAALEHQVFEQMGGAGGAGDLVARADAIRHHEGEHGGRVVLQQQHAEVVRREPVLRNATDGFHKGESLDGSGGRASGAKPRQRGGRQ